MLDLEFTFKDLNLKFLQTSLTLTLNKKEINPRIARWALELQNYDYSLEHRSGKRMQHVDALSRNTTIFVLEANSFDENLIICQGKDIR